MNLEAINLVLDFILVLAAVWMIFVVRGSIGGIVGKAFSFITWGVIILGVAHIVETITFEVLHWDVAMVELVHRLIVLVGFVLLTLGFKKVQEIGKGQ